MGRRLSFAAMAALALGMVGLEARADSPTPTQNTTGDSKAVIGVIDSGINPYHLTFRDNSARAQQHPSTYIAGYPKDAVALRLNFSDADYYEAVVSDCDIWSSIQPDKLYWFPGTRIVGGISLDEPAGIDCDAEKPAANGIILDANGHGTMTASRAASSEYGACHDCLIVAAQMSPFAEVGTIKQIKAIEWVAANSSWIDAQSNSWGPIVPLWDPTGQAGLFTSNPELARAVEATSRKHLAFWASGNGALFRFGVAGHPTIGAAHLTPSAVIVGGHDSGFVNTWPGFSAHLVSDSCASWAANHDDTTKSGDSVGSGTSAATPFAAGVAGEQLLTARRILGHTGTGVHNGVVARGPAGRVQTGPLADGVLTVEEWKRLLYVTATPRPEAQFEDGPACSVLSAPYQPTPLRWADVPPGYPEYVQIGYGATDGPAKKLASMVLRGLAPAPDRSSTDAYFALDRQVREAGHEVFSKP